MNSLHNEFSIVPKTIRRGRREGRNLTRPAIFEAARKCFAAGGFRGTSIRAIADEAGVDPALVHHFFGSKAELYAQATTPDDETGTALLDAMRTERPAEALIAAFLQTWDRPDPAHSPLAAMLRSAAGDPEAERRLATLIATTVVAPATVAGDRKAAMPKLRAHLVAAQFCGLAWLRYVARIEPIASASPALLARTYGPALERLLGGT